MNNDGLELLVLLQLDADVVQEVTGQRLVGRDNQQVLTLAEQHQGQGIGEGDGGGLGVATGGGNGHLKVIATALRPHFPVEVGNGAGFVVAPREATGGQALDGGGG